jgi:hypothetical protein
MAVAARRTAAKASVGRWIAGSVVGAALAGACIFGVIRSWAPAPARVLVTGDDCLRAFDAAACKALVDRALALHNRTAPGFTDRALCVLAQGEAMCKPINDGGVETARFAPPMVAVLVGRTPEEVLPLYFGPDKPTADKLQSARPVYFHGAKVGTLALLSFAGADLPVVEDASGEPISVAAVARLRGK